MGSSTPKQAVVDYRMSIHFGVCTGPVDALLGVWVGEKEALNCNVGDPTVFNIGDKVELFGGVKKEGGVRGALHYLPGAASQVLSTLLAGKLGRLPLTCPAFRGIASLFFTEPILPSEVTGGTPFNVVGDGSTMPRVQKGFYWTSNTPYLRSVWARVTRCPQSWYPEKAVIRGGPTQHVSIFISADGSQHTGEETPTRYSISRAAVDAALDIIKDALLTGEVIVDLAIYIPGGIAEYGMRDISITAASIESLYRWALNIYMPADGDGGGGYWIYPVTHPAITWFNDSLARPTITKRVFIMLGSGEVYGVEHPDFHFYDGAIYDGDAWPGVIAMNDILTRTGGSFNEAAGTAVDCYVLNLGTSLPSHAGLFDNTPKDGVPQLTAGNLSPFTDIVRGALTSGRWSDSNPAHIIYNCLTDTDWGMGTSNTALDMPSFTAAADTLYAEGLGLSMIWTRQAKIEDFVAEVLNHINGTLFVSPRTGLITIKLIRDDYGDPALLPVVNADNANFSNFQRKSPAETVNEIQVTWTNPTNEQDETVTIQDLGGIAVQGAIVSDSRNYYGVRSRGLAMKLAARDIAVASAPLASCDAEVDRSAWDFIPGGVVRMVYPEYGIAQMVMRIMQVDYGRPGEPTIKLSLMEDVFRLPVPSYVIPPETAWTDPSEYPQRAAYTEIFTLPYFFANMLVDPTALSGAAYPDVFAGILAAQTGTDTSTYELIGPDVDPAGNAIMDGAGTKDIASRGTLTALAAQEATSAMTFSGVSQGTGPVIGGFVIIGEGTATEGTAEIGLITGYADSAWTVSRGVLDTVPRAWPADTAVWFVSSGMRIADNTAQAALQIVNYRVLPTTSKGTLSEVSAPLITETLTERPHLPLRPANVTMGGAAFGTVDATAIDPVPITWANRNRLLENSQVLGWTGAGVTPEAGQTTRIRIYDNATGTLVTTISDIAGSSYDLPHSAFSGATIGRVRLTAVRDGMESLQGHEITVIVATGYGQNYGVRYGQ